MEAGEAGGASILALALVAAASAAGSWSAAVGLPDLGAEAAGQLGMDLRRFVLAPRPGPRWPEVVATLFGGMDVVVLRPPTPVRGALAHRLAARAKERRVVLVVLSGRHGWPEHPDLRLAAESVTWTGVGRAEGHLRGRRVTVVASGRRAAARPVRVGLWLPTARGGIAPGGAGATGGTVR